MLLTYPLATTFAIVVTGNHYVLDAAGGAVVLALGFSIALSIARFGIVERAKQLAFRPDGSAKG